MYNTGPVVGGKYFAMGQAGGRSDGDQRWRRERDDTRAGVRENHAQRDGRGEHRSGGGASRWSRWSDCDQHGVDPWPVGREGRRPTVAGSGQGQKRNEDDVRRHVGYGD